MNSLFDYSALEAMTDAQAMQAIYSHTIIPALIIFVGFIYLFLIIAGFVLKSNPRAKLTNYWTALFISFVVVGIFFFAIYTWVPALPYWLADKFLSWFP